MALSHFCLPSVPLKMPPEAGTHRLRFQLQRIIGMGIRIVNRAWSQQILTLSTRFVAAVTGASWDRRIPTNHRIRDPDTNTVAWCRNLFGIFSSMSMRASLRRPRPLKGRITSPGAKDRSNKGKDKSSAS